MVRSMTNTAPSSGRAEVIRRSASTSLLSEILAMLRGAWPFGRRARDDRC
jgi:hypothetical protein